ncbi:MAG: hypothetical protein K9H64_16920 [Bacteroidales bacterium]|nr:hypothetical protein [Bacteroidales bacterium]MCF8457631.1 hypothetical protein [Bacteroidales bacterium]
MKYIYKGISKIFHPLLLPTFGLLVIFNSGSYHSYLTFEVKKVILSVYFVSTVLLPLSVFPFFYYQKIIRNWAMTDHRERVLPILVVSAFHFFAWYMIGRYPIPPLYKSFVFYTAVGSLLAALLSIRWNISVHVLAIGGLVGFTLALAFSESLDLHFMVMVMIVATGLLIFSRLGLNKNTARMVYLSFLLGMLMMFVPVYFF